MEDFMWITMPKKLKEFRLRFNVYDRDQDGIVKVNDLLYILTDMGMAISRAQLDTMMRNVDLAGRDDIHFDEFVMMAARHEACEDSYKELKEAFKVFDNGKGSISVRDFRTVMQSMGERLSQEEIEDMLQEAHIQNGHIKINDFITVLCR